ncbi:MAG TPA: NAD-dependent malic enzyme, partial [Vicinamibacteria bacterium]|nr:NAD-dependent malic enzyme [Vicinamibacteria bacterium]
LNKGTAFTADERAALGLEGLLPSAVGTPEQEARRAYAAIARKHDALEQYIGLAALQDRDERLFYRVLIDHFEELLPIVYTPTVGRACQEFSHIFRQPRGIWLTPEHRGRIESVLENAPFPDVRLIVVTDNERILGLGDQGAGGMPIPIGKLALYTAAAGIPPTRTLPVSLDVGTDNPTLLADELYVGWRHPRLRGELYDALVDEFVTAVKRRFPRALLQWEDFKTDNAFRLSERYRSVLPSFNDDIQGTGAAALAGILAAGRVTGARLREQRMLIVGAGAAGIGIARQVREGMRADGLEDEALRGAIALVDVEGLLVEGVPGLDPRREPFAWPRALAEGVGLLPAAARRSLEAVVRGFRPTVLVGACGQPGAFHEAAVRAMAVAVERPVILPMSNPTSHAEAWPGDLLAWTEGRALVATGSPFPPVAHAGRSTRVGQVNNAFVFPGLGLGALVSEAREVSGAMFTVAAESLARETTAADLADGSLFPRVSRLREAAVRIAEAVVKEARDSGLGRPIPDEKIPEAVRAAMWSPGDPLPGVGTPEG